MKQLSPGIERLIAAAVLCAAFVVMASIFVPASSPASDERADSSGSRSPAAAGHEARDSASASHHHGSVNRHSSGESTDPHADLISFGQIEDGCYIVQIYATESGPRYSVYDTIDGRELAVLMTAQQVARYFPDLPLEDLDFSTGSLLMRADAEPEGALPQ
jgi:hypothetical protein